MTDEINTEDSRGSSADTTDSLRAPLHDCLVVGVDLGTSNSALAFRRPGATTTEALAVAQLEGPGRIGSHKTLPSALYIPHAGELTPADARLPWQDEASASADGVIGVFARERGAQVPERLVASAKSWLCNAQIDRSAPLLPWRSPIETGKRSPIEASRLYLEHLRHALDHELGSARAAEAEAVLTVPASFDEVARNLTYEAATAAGFERVTLLEEPLAAFYSWIAGSGGDWRAHVAPGDVVLVCDVGGGTTDFSLIAVSEEQGRLRLERIAVGDHLLLGGDNMDLALAYTLKAQLEAEGRAIDHWQFLSLVASARVAKERILAGDEPGLEPVDSVPVTIASRGSSLFAQTIAVELTRATVERVLLDGFFPATRIDQLPTSRRGSGIQELGLHYETDAAVVKHLARFLRRARQNAVSNDGLRKLVEERLAASEASGALMPSKVLFNGGVFKAPALRRRVLEVLRSWSGAELEELAGAHLDLAVAAGAAYYGAVRASGKGIRVLSGLSRSYYVGLESPMPAVPGIEPPVKGLCLVPQGTEEGTELELPGQQFGLVVGEPVEFRFFSSAVRAGDGVGAVVDDATHELDETSRLTVTLPAADGQEGEVVPVKIDAVVTEVGTLQLFMRQLDSERKWNLEFNVRPHEDL
jgi:molecular chaperone DnaK (HSP70)